MHRAMIGGRARPVGVAAEVDRPIGHLEALGWLNEDVVDTALPIIGFDQVRIACGLRR